eukprot:170674-Amphidinium_carterae.1
MKAHTAEAAPPLARIGVRLLRLLMLFCFFELGSAAGSPADSESSTPNHLFQEMPLPPSNPPVAQGATYHPMSELALLEAHMQIDPGNEVLLAERSRLMRQAWRLWNLHTSGAIPPLDDQVAFEVTLVLGLETPGTTDAPVFPMSTVSPASVPSILTPRRSLETTPRPLRRAIDDDKLPR